MEATGRGSIKYRLEFEPEGVFMYVDFDASLNLDQERKNLVCELEGKISDLNTKQILHADIKSDKRILIAPPQEISMDGLVEAMLSEDQATVLLRVTPHAGKGAPATREQVMEKIQAAGAEAFRLDLDKIDALLSSPEQGQFVAVGEKAHGAMDLIMTKDRLHMSATLIPPFGGELLSMEQALQTLLDQGVLQEFIDEQKIREMLNAEKHGETFFAANGVAPEHGADAWLQPLYDMENSKPRPSITDEGDVDYYELGVFSTVRIGDEIAKVIHATIGRDGVTVTGQAIPARKGREASAPCAANTAFSDTDPDIIVSTINGRPCIAANRISVEPILDIPGNVDFSTGNISFMGFVNIKGNVLSGFRVRASHDINIEGVVEAAQIQAGGNLSIKQGVLGQGRASITAGGDMYCKYLDKATVAVDGNLVVTESILHSDVSVDGGVFLGDAAANSKAGRIIGGIIRAKSSIRANSLGNDLQTETRLEIGLSKAARATLTRMENEIAQRQLEVETLLKNLAYLEKKVSSGAEDEETLTLKRQTMVEAYHKKSLVHKATENMNQIRDSVASGGLAGSRVVVRNILHPGVTIAILGARRKFRQEYTGVVVFESDGDVLTAEYQAASGQGGPVLDQ